jgi:hypothetical protein
VQLNHVDTRAEGASPFFSICVPQYNRTSFLIDAVRALGRQTFRDVEICISDDRSTDGREADLLAALRETGLPFVYRKQDGNTRYDGNLRAAIDMSRGRYCFLLGNDDRPATDRELERLHADVQAQGSEVGVVITNYQEIPTGRVVRRMPRTENLGAGPMVAAQSFRDFSFVSGIVLHGERARAWTTSKWDGSEMYQMYIGCRIIAEGLPLLSIERVAVSKDIQIPGEQVDGFVTQSRIDPCPIIERKHTLHLLAPLVADAMAPFVSEDERGVAIEAVVRQILLFTYPFWIFQHRRFQSWNFAAGSCLGMRPRNTTKDLELGPLRRARLASLYAAVTAVGLVTPIQAFERARPLLHRIAKSGLGRRSVRGSTMQAP